MREFGHWKQKFDDKAECLDCPTRVRGRVCLLPECWEGKNAAAIERIQEETRAAIAELGDEPIELLKLESRSYERIDGGACDVEDCEHWNKALDWHKNIVPICLKPECYKAKWQARHDAQKAAEAAAKHAAFTAAHNAIATADEEMIRRMNVLALYHGFTNSADGLLKAMQLIGVNVNYSDVMKLISNRHNDKSMALILDLMMQIPLEELVQITALAACCSENLYGYSSKAKTRWMMGEELESQAGPFDEVEDNG